MLKIQEKLDSLQPYVNGVRYIDGIQIVDAVLKDGWSVPTSDVIKQELVDAKLNYYMFFSENGVVTFDDLLDYVESVININIERENKITLLKLKVKELQVIFKEKSLKELEGLKFTFTESKSEISDLDMDLVSELNVTLEPTVIEDSVGKDKDLNTNAELITDNKNSNTEERLTPVNTDTNGDCDCEDTEACSKCIDNK